MADLEWINWQQACKIMSCSKSHFYNLVNSGVLRSRRSGLVRGVTVRREDCEKWAKEWRERFEGCADEIVDTTSGGT